MTTEVVMLTPRQIADRYGISPSQLCRYCTRTDDRLPSVLIKGRNGRRGKRLVRLTDLEAWLAQFNAGASRLNKANEPAGACESTGTNLEGAK
jgi:hypothetical protein